MSERSAASQVAAAVAILALFAAVSEGWLADIVAQVQALVGRSSIGSNARTPGSAGQSGFGSGGGSNQGAGGGGGGSF